METRNKIHYADARRNFVAKHMPQRGGGQHRSRKGRGSYSRQSKHKKLSAILST